MFDVTALGEVLIDFTECGHNPDTGMALFERNPGGAPANVAAASRAVEGMLLLIENHTPLEDQTVRYCISLAHDGAEKRVKELTEDFVTVTVKGRISQCHPHQCHHLWRWPGGYRQDLSGRCHGGKGF